LGISPETEKEGVGTFHNALFVGRGSRGKECGGAIFRSRGGGRGPMTASTNSPPPNTKMQKRTGKLSQATRLVLDIQNEEKKRKKEKKKRRKEKKKRRCSSELLSIPDTICHYII
jgi:hypothetical protein